MEKKPRKYPEIIAETVTPSERFTVLSEDPYVAEGRIVLPYRYFAGKTGTKFLVGLRDEKKIRGTRCPVCSKVYLPPRGTCGTCFSNLEEWVDLSGRGTVSTFTVTHYDLPAHPAEAPLIYGVIQLDGADTGLTHMIGEVDPAEVHIGMRVEAVFKEEGQGNILDIRYFRPTR